ncbi:hypothetical protein BGI33_09490 [Snodgrassella alvi]|nr:hypothetical protein BGI33_09490 [Snodgrassella alvi]PIT18207.1 hypothetical protein BGI34_05735 [Snodgrassella alvi]
MIFNLLYFAADKVLGFAGVFLCNSTLAGIIFSHILVIKLLWITIYALAGYVFLKIVLLKVENTF